MGDGWGEELGEAETEALLTKAADVVLRRRLEVPAIMALEMHKPISGYVGNMAVVFAPFLGPIFGPDTYRDFSRLLLRRHNIERLIAMIEERRTENRPPMETPAS